MNIQSFIVIIAIIFINNIWDSDEQIIKRYDPNLFYNKTKPEIYASWLNPIKDQIEVEIGLRLLNFGPLDEKRSKFTIMLQIYVTWFDQRLSIESQNLSKESHLEIDEWHLSRIWKPIIYLANSKPFTPDILNNKFTGQIYGLITGAGKVSVIKKIQFDASCKFNIKFYPMDTQSCSIEIESSSLSSRNMHLKWSHNPIEIPSNFQWSNFDMKNFSLHSGLINYEKAGPYLRLKAIFKLRRHMTHYLFNVYLPSTLFVISSWSAFWIDIPAAPARVALVLTTMLTHVTSTKSIHEQLPKTMFISALDIWIIMCTMFIFAAIIEYSTANYFYHKPSRIRDKANHCQMIPKQPAVDNNDNNRNDDLTTTANNVFKGKRISYYWHQIWTKILPPFDDENFSARRVALEMDRRSRYVFPITFFLFNIFYWAILAIYSDKQK